MSKYVVYFEKDKKSYRLPVNPEEISISSTQAIQKYEVLKLGQIAVPTHMELLQYSFEVELPHQYHYGDTPDYFIPAEEFLKLFQDWRVKKEPIKFRAGQVTSSNKLGKGSIDSYVLIEDLTITEKAGEEQDKYVSIKLLEYKEYTKKKISVKKNPKNKGYYIVKKGDTLWAIAKKYYGNGNKYPKIFKANTDKIKNPNLIYPGQKLVIPDE